MPKPLYIIAALYFLCLRHSIAEPYSSMCSPFGCSGDPIFYPFWADTDNSEYCGYPGLGLKCSDDGQTIISLPSNTYYVTDIDYDDHTLTLVDMDVANQSCPRAQYNLSLGNFPLSFNNKLNVNLSFYFNCSSSNNINLPPQHIGCLKNEGLKQSYVFEATHALDMDCEEKVVAVVKKEEIRTSDNLVTGFGEAMNMGFVLDWKRPIDCVECENSGGRCGYNQTNHQMLCFCVDGGGSIATRSCRKADKEYWECQPSSCGKVGQIYYPFWAETSRPSFCGRPGFQLICPQAENDYPLIQIGSQIFMVLQIDPFTHKMTLYRPDFIYNDCSLNLTNTTLSSHFNVFHYDEPYVKNVTLFYDCPKDYWIKGIKFECQILTSSNLNSTNYALLSEDAEHDPRFPDLVNNCKHHIVVPVSIRSEVRGLDYSQTLLDALDAGFSVQYSVDEACAKCLESLGSCGSNDTSPFICYCPDGHHHLHCSDSSDSSENSRPGKMKFIIGFTSGAIGTLLICIIIFCWIIKSLRQKIDFLKAYRADPNIEAFIRNHGPLALTRYKYAEVKRMSKSFQVKLGQGGYGAVYKGELVNGCPVAIKLLKSSKGNGEEFINEVASINMVGEQKNINTEDYTTEIYFPDWVYDKLDQDSKLGQDGTISIEENDIAKKMTIVGLWCIQTFPTQRPTISRVIEMLEGSLDSLEVPPKPVMPSHSRLEHEVSATCNTNSEEVDSESSSLM